MRVTNPDMAAGRLVLRDVLVAADEDGAKGMIRALEELISLLRNAPGYPTSSDRLRIWISHEGNRTVLWGVKGDARGPMVRQQLLGFLLLYDGPTDEFAAEQLVEARL